VDARRQEHGLAVVARVAEVALLDDDDRPVAVLDEAAQGLRADAADEDGLDVVHARLGEEVAVLAVHQQPDVARGHEELHVRRVVEAAPEAREAEVAVRAARREVRRLVCAGDDVRAREYVLDARAPVLGLEHVGVLEGFVRRGVFVKRVILLVVRGVAGHLLEERALLIHLHLQRVCVRVCVCFGQRRESFWRMLAACARSKALHVYLIYRHFAPVRFKRMMVRRVLRF
jgi:hypothetical protein